MSGNIRITQNDRIILTLLAKPPIQVGLNADEVINYLWGLKSFSNGFCKQSVSYAFKQSTKRRLAQLTKHKFIKTTRYCDESKQCYFLLNKGLYLVNEDQEYPYQLKKRAQNLGYLKHARLTASSILNIMVMAANCKDEVSCECTEMKIPLKGSNFFIPDSTIGISGLSGDFLFYLEADRATEPFDYFREKIIRYLNLFTSGSEDKDPEYLLIVASSFKRIRFLFNNSQKTLDEVGGNTPFKFCFLFSYLGELEKHDPCSGWINASVKTKLTEDSFTEGLLDESE